MSDTWFIGDTHFGHNHILNFSQHRGYFVETVHDQDEMIIEMWNSIVKKRDKVFHLGDVAFNKTRMMECVPRLNGVKHLIMGNHDTFTTESYLKAGFSKVSGVGRLDGFVLTHVPMHPSMFEFRWKYNIHGHIHDRKYDLGMPYINVNMDSKRIWAPMHIDQIYSMVEEYEKSLI